jgi:EpsI family protein
MPVANAQFGFLGSKPARVLTLVLLAQLAGVFAITRKETVPLPRPLDQFPQQLGAWEMFQEGTVEKEVMAVLRADDVLTRTYVNHENGLGANLFVAYFKSQRSGQAPHSPKNCLPGAGWVPSESDTLAISIPGRAEPLHVNRYLVAKGDERSLVLYWYQSRDRVIASEYQAKFYLVADAIRLNRTDTALVRVVVPVRGNDAVAATETAAHFVQAFFTPLRQHLPS